MHEDTIDRDDIYQCNDTLIYNNRQVINYLFKEKKKELWHQRRKRCGMQRARGRGSARTHSVAIIIVSLWVVGGRGLIGGASRTSGSSSSLVLFQYLDISS